MSVIVDTNFLIRLVRKDPGAEALLNDIKRSGEPIVLPTPVIFELEVGLALVGDPLERTRFEQVTQNYAVRDFDEERARRAGRIQAAILQETGNESGDIDVQVVSFAVPRRDSVVSNDRGFGVITQVAGIPLRRFGPASADG